MTAETVETTPAPAQDGKAAVETKDDVNEKEKLINTNTDPGDGVPFINREIRAFLTSLMFFTRIPVPMWVDHDLYWVGLGAMYFPVLGVIVGGWGAIVYLITSNGGTAWNPAIGAIMSTLATVHMTGAFHEDGLADTFDGFGGGWGREQILLIMRDSRIGTYGAIGLFLVTLTKLLALASLPSAHLSATTLIAGHVLGRWSSCYLTHVYDYVQNASAPGKEFKMEVGGKRVVTATLMTAVIVWSVVPGWVAWCKAMGTAWVVTILAGRYIHGVLGGVIGDCLGAANQIVEIITYLVLTCDFDQLFSALTKLPLVEAMF
ncbi:hypothetical protein HK102_011747 [Quaeritorhiza haematococci]|nr:hypothetical protein HK102_011747 [Quaeritorhiza haematococci]